MSVSALAPAAPGPRIAAVDWAAAERELDAVGYALLRGLLEPAACTAIAGLWQEAVRFRRKVVMARHGYGQGEYQYFTEPLPEPVVACGRASIRLWRGSRTAGTRLSACLIATPRRTPTSSCAATQRVRRGRRPCC